MRARWRPLIDRAGGSALLFLLQTPARIAPGAHALAAAIDGALLGLEEQVGAPAGIDLITHGGAGLQARAYLATSAQARVRKAILLGCPSLGTARARVEARAEFAGRPARPLEGGEGAPGSSFAGAAEETPEFLARFNEEVREAGGAEVHLVAGDRGLDRLDGVLGCGEHDDRVCVESALAGVPGAALHRVAESHGVLGRGPLSLALVLGEILGLGAAGGGGDRGDGGGDGGVLEPGPAEPAGDGAAAAPSAASGVYTGVLEPGDSGIFPLTSDTSESIIIILNSELPGGLQFRVRTPSGQVVDPASAVSLGIAEYYTYGDGEGHELQAYKLHAAEVGDYEALLDNDPANAAIRFTLEAYVESELVLDAVVDPDDLPLGGRRASWRRRSTARSPTPRPRSRRAC